MRTMSQSQVLLLKCSLVGMKPLSERDENCAWSPQFHFLTGFFVGMKPLSERDENRQFYPPTHGDVDGW